MGGGRRGSGWRKRFRSSPYRRWPLVTLSSRLTEGILKLESSRQAAMECPHCHRQTSHLSKNCGSCGLLIPPAQYLLEESGVIDSEATASSSDIRVAQPSGQPAHYRMASLGDRFIAFVLDTLALFGVFTIID